MGDNLGVGPNPGEVIDLLEQNNVISIAGNSEEYITLGIESFKSYFNTLKIQSQLWTSSKLNERQKGIISLYPHSIELLLSGKKIALCHFANDVRFDYSKNSTWSYQSKLKYNEEAYKQFLERNSQEQLEQMEQIIKIYGIDSPMLKGYFYLQKRILYFKGKW